MAKRKSAARITPRELHECHRWIPLDEISELPGNPNLGDKESLDASVDEFGWFDGIVVHRGVLVAGNKRYARARADGEEGLPGYDLSPYHLDDARRMAMALAHNHTNRAGANDQLLLGEALAGLDAELVNVAGGVEQLSGSGLAEYARQGGYGPGYDPAEGLDHQELPEPAYAVVVTCTDEAHQRKVYNDLQAAGHTVRVLTV